MNTVPPGSQEEKVIRSDNVPEIEEVKVDLASEVTGKTGSNENFSVTIIVDIKCVDRYTKLTVSRFWT